MEKMIERVKMILLNPKQTWETIRDEKADVKELFTGYLMILAAIGPICSLIGRSLVGVMGFRWSFGSSLLAAILSYIFVLASVYILAIVVNALAPQFASQKNMDQAIKLCVYFPTAALVAGVFHLIPALGIFAFLASLYSLYLLYIGLPIMMGTPHDKVIVYFITIIVVTVILMLILGAIMTAFVATSVMPFR